ncbi:MAG TPA: lamin tail domain-containing protein [Candidatus Paceibacterota bacterium]|nr:lamin tail domain-containing protein [Candidatus Paceibacterota bacterium]
MRWLTLGALLFLAPLAAFAKVEIAEIAWMGTADSSSNEWIELANTDTESITLDGWTLEASDGAPAIALSGTISGSGRYLIERTDDTTVPNVAADLIAAFGAGLANAGETLYLRNASGAIIDTVSGGENWSAIGGNNSTKETPQRTIAGWVTAPATPRAAPAGQSSGSGSTSTVQGSAPVEGSAAPSSSAPRSIFPRSGIGVYAGDDIHTFVGFPAVFVGSATGLYDEAIPQATYRWNFGDGTTAVGERAEHVYRFSGEYIVTLEVFWGTHRASDRAIASVSAPELRIARAVPGSEGFIELANASASEIDLSRWSMSIVGGSSSFIFPDQSFVRSGKSVMYANETTRLGFDAGSTIELRYPNGALASAYRSSAPVAPIATARPAAVSRPAGTSQVSASSSAAARTNAEPRGAKTLSPLAKDGKGKEVPPMVQNASAAALWEEGIEALPDISESPSSIPIGTQWFFALAGVILIALAGFIIARTKIDQATRADEFAIIEDIIEGKDDLEGKRGD